MRKKLQLLAAFASIILLSLTSCRKATDDVLTFANKENLSKKEDVRPGAPVPAGTKLKVLGIAASIPPYDETGKPWMEAPGGGFDFLIRLSDTADNSIYESGLTRADISKTNPAIFWDLTKSDIHIYAGKGYNMHMVNESVPADKTVKDKNFAIYHLKHHTWGSTFYIVNETVSTPMGNFDMKIQLIVQAEP